MEVGKLNKRLTIRTYGASTPTEFGGSVMSAPTDYETWGSAKQLSQYETLSNGLKMGEASFRFTFRYQQGTKITQRNEVLYLGRVFRISSIINEDEKNFYITVLGTERSN
jgi:SPP1 family predicted phage head-tail adaptor